LSSKTNKKVPKTKTSNKSEEGKVKRKGYHKLLLEKTSRVLLSILSMEEDRCERAGAFHSWS